MGIAGLSSRVRPVAQRDWGAMLLPVRDQRDMQEAAKLWTLARRRGNAYAQFDLQDCI